MTQKRGFQAVKAARHAGGRQGAAARGDRRLRAHDRPQAQEAFGIQARNLAALHAQGVPVALGTDGNTAWAAHGEMADMVAAGMTPADVIVAATRNSAELLGLDEAGTIEEGKSLPIALVGPSSRRP